MPGTISLNEARIQLDILKNLSVFKCSLPEISTRHRDQIVISLRQEQKRVSIFEGEVLFALQVDQQNINKDKQDLFSYLSKQKKDLNIRHVSLVPLREAPERVIDRLTFAMISFQAMRQGIFTIFGRILFRPTLLTERLAHKAVEASTCIEDGYLKIFLDPTFIALTEISKTVRQNKTNIELVGLCSFRNKKLCPLVRQDGACDCLFPGKLGYYFKEVKVAELDKGQKEYLEKRFRICPKFATHTDFTLVKSSKNGKIFSAYPSYTVFLKLSKLDLSSNPELRNQYRKATLMSSVDRLKYTNEWIKQIFFSEQKGLQNWGAIKINDVEIPVEIILSVTNTSDLGSPQGVYKTYQIQDQQIVNDSLNPTPQSYSGGWLFTSRGAFDRWDPKRPFKSVSPYLIIPNEEQVIVPTRQLFNWLSDGNYQSRFKGDQDFAGINQPSNKGKYNTSFTNVFKEEENLFMVDGSLHSYHSAVEDIKRDWIINSNRDLNKHVIVIIPDDDDNENNPYYYEIKKILVEEGIPSTFITLETLRKLEDPNVAFGPILQSIWLNIYAKMGGKPWRLANQLENVHCFIGIGFGINPRMSGNNIFAGIAHVFDKYGSWIDVASDSTNLTETDLDSFDGPEKFTQGSASFKISQSVTQNIVYNALKLYQQKQTKTHENATNIVLHKLGQIYECEVIGFLEGIRQVLGSLGGCKLGILQIEQDHHIRLYGPPAESGKENYTIYRGSALQPSQTKLVLATTGRSHRQTASGLHTNYPGIGTPQPLLLTSIVPSQQILQKYGCTSNQLFDIVNLSRHTMALTQLHWGSLKDNVRLPITALYAQKVADLISKTDARINAWLGYYRPWFL